MTAYQRLFDHMLENHNLVLDNTELDDIIQEALLVARKNGIHQLIKESDHDSIHRVTFHPVDSILFECECAT